MDILIIGVPLAALVTVIVELLKKTGRLPGNWPIAAALLVAQILVIGNHLASILPSFKTWWELAVMGLLAALASCGLWDGGNAVVGAAKRLLAKPE